MLFRQFILVALFSAFAGAALAKLVVSPAPAKTWIIAEYPPIIAS